MQDNSVSQVDGVSDMATACWLCGSSCEGSEKGQWPLPAFLFGRKLSSSSCLDARHFNSVSPFMPLLHFKSLPWCWSTKVSLYNSVCEFFSGNAWDSSNFFHPPNPDWFLQPEVVGTYLPGPGTLGWESCCGAGTPHSRHAFPEVFSIPTWKWDQLFPRLHPSYQSGWMWFL